jgi:ABC-2 type transport system ATP-binding protein
MRIDVEDLGRKFAGRPALRDVDFSCGPGEIVAVVGNNGAGKSTLLHLLGGFLVPTSGRILFDGEGLNRADEKQRQRIGFLADFPSFFLGFTINRHLAMVCALHGRNEAGLEDHVMTLMEQVGILHLGHKPMETLSRGEVFKTFVVGMILARPDLWLLDEPMASGMDPRGLRFLRTHLREAAGQGATVIYTTQIAEVAESFSDRVLALKSSRMVGFDTARNLQASRQAASFEQTLEAIFADANPE